MASKLTKLLPTTLHTLKSKVKHEKLTNPWSGNVIYAPSSLSEDVLENYTIPTNQPTFSSKCFNYRRNHIREEAPIESEYPNIPTERSRKFVSKTSRLEYRVRYFF